MSTKGFQAKMDQIISKYFLRFIPDYLEPNHFTLLRILLVPIVYILFDTEHFLLAFVVFIIAASTDFIDGAMARTRDEITDLGKVLDPIADKMLILTAILFIGFEYLIVKIFVVVILFEVIGIFSQALFAKYLERPIPANVFGKIKMVLQCVCVIVFFIGYLLNNKTVILASEYLLFLAFVFAMISNAVQMKNAYLRVHARRKEANVD